MDRLVFTANMAMSEYRLDRQNMTHELANVSTPGFKKAFQLANRAIRTEGDGFDTRYLPRAVTSPLIDLAPGPRIVTNKPLDIAMDNKTVLPVLAENGDIAWTRRGDMALDPEGFLRTQEGYLVLDESLQPIQLPQGGISSRSPPTVRLLDSIRRLLRMDSRCRSFGYPRRDRYRPGAAGGRPL